MKKRKNHSSGFKAKVALEAIRDEMTLAELSKKYGVRPTQIGTWKRAAIENMATAFNRKGSALETVSAADGDIRVADLVRNLGLAERQFRTAFTKLIGISPKVFCKTLQINSAFNQILQSSGGDLADVAVRSGLSDQAHFTRAFVEFLGKAPKGYLQDVEATLERFVGQSRS